MRHTRLISAAAGALFLGAALVGCSQDDLEKAKDATRDAAGEAGSKAGDAASDAVSQGSDALSDATGAADGADAGAATVDLGEFEGDAAAQTAAEYFEARYEAASGVGDLSALEALTTARWFDVVSAWVEDNRGLTGPWTIKVVGVEGGLVSTCVGKDASLPRTVTLHGGKVARNAAGDFAC